ncbi:kinase-like domain-containing protein [Limtongia smithiae]|uniref:kinase-like domain-containing protein n=1 Tax=Limtongia smithiae TaxID=1125753 RepID=UPI0034CD1501
MEDAAFFKEDKADLPKGLGFPINDLLGYGAFAQVYLCGQGDQKFATKFINKRRAKKQAGLKADDILREIMLQKHCSSHKNIVTCFGHGETEEWIWLKLQPASGDLFSKIEPDRGLPEDIARLYFSQLAAAVEYMHSMGIAHMDIKPENILLDHNGNLLLTDFGFATLYRHKKITRKSSKLCGSPPYCAPEVLAQEKPYEPNLTDVWSCGIVLFVLICGCTPWDWARSVDPDFAKFSRDPACLRNTYPWNRIPVIVLSLVKLMLRLNPQNRPSWENIRRHPWMHRANPVATNTGQSANPRRLATQLLVRMEVGVDDESSITQGRRKAELSNSQPTGYHARQPRPLSANTACLSQPLAAPATEWRSIHDEARIYQIALLQFAEHRDIARVTRSTTQNLRKFDQIFSRITLNRFYVMVSVPVLLSYLSSALQTFGVCMDAVPNYDTEAASQQEISIQIRDRRKCYLRGRIRWDAWKEYEGQFVEVVFDRFTGDPLEWRYFFKKVAQACRDIIYSGEFK